MGAPAAVHVLHRAPAEESASGASPAIPAPATDVQSPKLLSPERRAAGLRVSLLLGRAAANSCGQAAIARALGVSHATVGRWLDPSHPSAMTLRDVACAPPSFQRLVAHALVESLDDEVLALPLDLRLRRVAAEVGDVHRAALAGALADRHAIGREAREAAAELLALANECEHPHDPKEK